MASYQIIYQRRLAALAHAAATGNAADTCRVFGIPPHPVLRAAAGGAALRRRGVDAQEATPPAAAERDTDARVRGAADPGGGAPDARLPPSRRSWLRRVETTVHKLLRKHGLGRRHQRVARAPESLRPGGASNAQRLVLADADRFAANELDPHQWRAGLWLAALDPERALDRLGFSTEHDVAGLKALCDREGSSLLHEKMLRHLLRKRRIPMSMTQTRLSEGEPSADLRCPCSTTREPGPRGSVRDSQNERWSRGDSCTTRSSPCWGRCPRSPPCRWSLPFAGPRSRAAVFRR